MSAATFPFANARPGPLRSMVESMLQWTTKERIPLLKDGLQKWMDSICHSSPSPEAVWRDPIRPPVDGNPPSWEVLRLEVRSLVGAEDFRLEAGPLAEGDMLELVVGTDGEEVGRCLALRDGAFLREPDGPDWARRILVEAVAEWRLEVP